MTLINNNTINFPYSANPSGNVNEIDIPDPIDDVVTVMRELMANSKKGFDQVSEVLQPLTENLQPGDLATGGRDNDVLTRIGSQMRWSAPSEVSVFNTWCGVRFNYETERGDYVSNQKFFDTLDNAQNDNPNNITGDGQYLYVLDSTDDKIYAYDINNKANVPSREFNTLVAAGNQNPRCITHDQSYMYCYDASDQHIYAYDFYSFVREPTQEFDRATLRTLLGTTSINIIDMHYEAGYLLLLDSSLDIVYAIDTSSRSRSMENEYTQANIRRAIGSQAPESLWTDNDYLYLLAANRVIYTFNKNSKEYVRSKNIRLYDAIDLQTTDFPNPHSIWGDAEYLRILDLTNRSVHGISLYGQPSISRNGSNISSAQVQGNRRIRIGFSNSFSDTSYTPFTASRVVSKQRNSITLEYPLGATEILVGIL